jgi:hypothetical protein
MEKLRGSLKVLRWVQPEEILLVVVMAMHLDGVMGSSKAIQTEILMVWLTGWKLALRWVHCLDFDLALNWVKLLDFPSDCCLAPDSLMVNMMKCQ